MAERYPVWEEERTVMAVLLVIVLALLCIGISGCATYEAISSAPPDFWATAEKIAKAVFTDIGTIVSWIF